MFYNRDKMDEHGGGQLGHSNDSLLASADEMAGDYSPHTPSISREAAQPTSARTLTHDGTSSNKASTNTVSAGSNFTMPAEPVAWTQAVHPDSIQRLMSMESETTMETFPDAAKIYSHVNPETFTMPLEARVICMKIDKSQDMRYAIKVGNITNLPSCNERLDEIWKSRNGERVFMMFSISGAKEFCAMAEVNSGVRTGSMPGWTKAGCEGVIDLSFIYIKDVPFRLVNHIKHKGNGQPVANMWNSMLYHDNTGYQVAKIYIEHPVLSSVLINFRSEMQMPYKSQLRIQSSGHTAYSASSFGSKNDKNYDPRSATRVSINRSGNRSQWSGTDRRAIQNQPWRPNGYNNYIASMAQKSEVNDDNPTPVAPRRQGLFNSNPGQLAASPPRFQLADKTCDRKPSSTQSATSFTTPDERLLANFSSFKDLRKAEEAEKRIQERETVPSMGHNSPRGFSVGRGGHGPRRQQQLPLTINTDWRNQNPNIQGVQQGNIPGAYQSKMPGAYQNNARACQWQDNTRTPRASAFASQPPSGFGTMYNNGHSYGTQAIPPPPVQRSATYHYLPSPATSSENVGAASFPQVQQPPQGFTSPSAQFFPQVQTPTQGFATPSAQLSQNRESGENGLAHSVPFSARFSKQGERASQYDQDGDIKRGSPIKHSHSMPLMMQPNAIEPTPPRLRAQAVEFDPSHHNSQFASSPVIEDWVVTTPTRATAKSEQTPSKSQALILSSDAKFDESRISNLSKPEQHKYHGAQLLVLEFQINALRTELAKNTDEALERQLAEMESQHRYHSGKKSIVEVFMKILEKDHDNARGDLAQETVEPAPVSPSTPLNSSDFSRSRPSDGFEETIVRPEHDENGKILRSASKNGDGKATHMSQVVRHRRGGICDPNTGGFTGSFDARLVANVEDVLASPSRENAHPVGSQQRPNFRFAGGESISAPTPPQYGSFNDDGYHTNDSSFDDGNDSADDIESQVSVTENDDDVFSPRGRLYFRSNPTRDASLISHQGGIGLDEGHEYE